MAFRGRGRGRGGRGFGFEHRRGNHSPFVPFPDIHLPELPTIRQDDGMLIRCKHELESFWKRSVYYLGDGSKSGSSDVDIERYSDTLKQGSQKRQETLASYLKLIPSNFPAELLQGAKQVQYDKKSRLRWDQDSERLDHFEKLEAAKSKDNDANKEDNDEDKTDEEEEKEESDIGDYDQNIDFDDDDDDLNDEAEETVDIYDAD